MSTDQPMAPPPAAPPAPSQPHNGMGVASLVLGVASLVAAISFILFPIGLLGGLVGLVIGILALTGKTERGATNGGQAIAGVICSVLALIIAVDLAVTVGAWAARNTGTFARFDKCVAQAANRTDISNCIAGFAKEVRP